MTPKTRGKKAPAPMTQKEFRAVMRRIDANIKKFDTYLKESKKLDAKMAPNLKALKELVGDE